MHRIKSVQLCNVINDMQSATDSNNLTCSRQNFKSLMVSKIKPGVLSVSMFSIFLKVEEKTFTEKGYLTYLFINLKCSVFFLIFLLTSGHKVPILQDKT